MGGLKLVQEIVLQQTVEKWELNLAERVLSPLHGLVPDLIIFSRLVEQPRPKACDRIR